MFGEFLGDGKIQADRGMLVNVRAQGFHQHQPLARQIGPDDKGRAGSRMFVVQIQIYDVRGLIIERPGVPTLLLVRQFNVRQGDDGLDDGNVRSQGKSFEAARDEIQSRFLEKTGGATRFARQIGPTQDSAFMKKLDTIFGPGRGDKLYEAASRYNAFSKTSQTVDQAAEEMLKNRVAGVGSTRGIGNAADVATVGVQSGQGRFSSGALMGAMRRLFVENQKASNTRMQQALLEMAGKQGPEADQAIADIMRLVNSGRSTSTTGVGGAMGGSTSSLYNANEGPQRR